MKLFRKTFQAMGTQCEIQLFCQHPNIAQQTTHAVIADVQRLEARYSRYKPDSFLSKINQCAAQGGEIEVDAETASLLNYATTCYEQSDGLFDISSGLLRKAWRFDQQQIPDPDYISELLTQIGWHRLHWQAPKLSFPTAGMELDFGGIVKEYAVDRAAVLCLTQGVKHGLINLGGDIKIVGPRVDGLPWQIGVAHPRKLQTQLTTLSLNEGAIASSGDYERCMEINGKRYGHVLNPKTGWPVAYMASVTVVAEFCVLAGSASTITMLKEEQGSDWLQTSGLPHYWVDVTGQCGGSLLPAEGEGR